MSQARAELEAPFQQALDAQEDVRKLWPERDRREFLAQKIGLLPDAKGSDDLRWRLSERLHILAIVVGLVLLVACANVATLLLARATARQREIAARLALGASRARLVRQLLTESLLLAGMGGVLGMLFAAWGHRILLLSFVADTSNTAVPFQLDQRVLGFALAVSLLTEVLFGTMPALRATRVELSQVLKGGGRNTAGGLRLGLAKGLLVAQVAASLLLLITTGLLVRTLRNLQSQDTGFNRENVLLMRIDPGPKNYTDPRTIETYRQLLERLNALPGVRSASLAGNVAFGEGCWNKTIWVEGHQYSADEDQTAEFNEVGPRFFDTVGVPLVLGREFGPQDHMGAPRVVLVNQAMARRYFPNENPIGKHFGDHGPASSGKYEIIGVVRDSKYGSLREQVGPTVYDPLFQVQQAKPVVLHVRTPGNPASVVARIRQEVQVIDRDLPVFDVQTLAEQVQSSLHQERMFATLSGFFGLLALLLSCIGLYGVVAYSVARRTNEIGIRMALGAQGVQILWMVLREMLLLVTAGVVLGLPTALASTRIVANQLYGVKPTDALTLVAATLVLAVVATLAGYLPARTASGVDPMVTLRYE